MHAEQLGVLHEKTFIQSINQKNGHLKGSPKKILNFGALLQDLHPKHLQMCRTKMVGCVSGLPTVGSRG